jgi:pimeloyl-ACP methyl ester carboxylesterase
MERTDPSGTPRTPARHRRSAAGVLVAVVAVAVLAAACSSATTASGNGGNSASTVSTSDNTRYSVPGPYAAGTARYTLSNGDNVQIWYPVAKSAVAGQQPYTYSITSWLPASLQSNPFLADLSVTYTTNSYLNAPLAPDPTLVDHSATSFPVALFSHGFGSFPEQSSFLTSHLAQWGFVVAAPDHRSRDLAAVLTNTVVTTGSPDVTDLLNTLTFLRSEDTTPGNFFSGKLDLSEVGVLGHSAGGGAAVTFAANPAVRTYVAMAPAGGVPPPTSKPGLVMYGSSDGVVTPSSVQNLYAKLPTPKRLVVIAGAGHNVFDDICQIGKGSQRLVVQLQKLPKSILGTGALSVLAGDGCFPPDLDPVTAQPLIDQAATAQLLYGVGINATPVGLDTGLDHAFPGVSATYYQKT